MAGAPRVALVDFSKVVVARDVNAEVKILDQTWGDYDSIGIRVVSRWDTTAPAARCHPADRSLIVADVDPADVVALTTEGDDTQQDIAEIAVPLITTMAKAYTRGNGFVGNVPNEAIAAVITTASARFVGNPKQASESSIIGPFTLDRRSCGFESWTIAEQIVLNRYRLRAM